MHLRHIFLRFSVMMNLIRSRTITPGTRRIRRCALVLFLCSAPALAQQDSLLQVGVQLSADGRYTEAIRVLRGAGADTGSAFGRMQLGLAYARLNEFSNARRFLSEAASMAPDNADFAFQHALFLHQNLVLPEALQSYRRVLELDSAHASAWFQLAQISRALQEPIEDVRRFYRTSIRLNPGDYIASFYLGSSLADSGDTHLEGEHFLKRAAELNPYYVPTIERLGSYYSGLRKDSLAAQQYARAVDLRPKNPDFWFYLGESLRKMRRTDSAITCFREAIRLDPTQSIYVGQLGFAFVQAKEYGRAVEAYTRAIELEPDNVQFYRNLAIAYERTDSVDASVEAYLRAIQALEPGQFADLYNQIGHVRYRAHQYEAAGRSYRKSLAFDPSNHEAVFFLAIVLDQMEEYEEALKRYKEFLRLLPADDSPNARTNVARTRVTELESLISRTQRP